MRTAPWPSTKMSVCLCLALALPFGILWWWFTLGCEGSESISLLSCSGLIFFV